MFLNFKRGERLLGKSDRGQLCTFTRISQIPLPRDYLLLSLPVHPLTCTRLSESYQELKTKLHNFSYMGNWSSKRKASPSPVSFCSAVPIISCQDALHLRSTDHTRPLQTMHFTTFRPPQAPSPPVQSGFVSDIPQHKQVSKYFSLESYIQRFRLKSPHQPPPLPSIILHKKLQHAWRRFIFKLGYRISVWTNISYFS